LADGGSWGFSGNDVILLIGELEYKYSLFDKRLPGAIDVGAVYFSGGDISGQMVPYGYGYHVQLEQVIVRENPCVEGDSQGLGAFVSYFPRFANRDFPIQSVWGDLVGGVVYRGLIPDRDQDVVGAGASWATLNKSGSLQETVIDVFYRASLTPWLTIQPDLQYIASPTGIHRDAIAVGLRFQVAL